MCWRASLDYNPSSLFPARSLLLLLLATDYCGGGRFLSCFDDVYFVRYTGVFILVWEGKHTCEAIDQSKQPPFITPLQLLFWDLLVQAPVSIILVCDSK